MIATLTVALSLAAAAPAIDVPFLAQTDAMCGGAAAAMVFRYWGDAHADVQEFAHLVDRRAGGIVNAALIDAVTARGWRAGRIAGSLEALIERVRGRQPVIVLVPQRGNRYHYVVVTGATDDAIVVHDPSWGPSRSMRAADFERAWRAAGFWSLVILPPAANPLTAGSESNASADSATAAVAVPATSCDVKLTQAIAEVRERGFDRADAALGRVHAECPGAAGPLRELSGIRFAQRRWAEAESFASAALERDRSDAYALDILGSSRFMRDDAVGALRAWNEIEKPRVNLVKIDGARHTRQQTIAQVLGIQPNMLLDAGTFERARRRINELPGYSGAALRVRPEADGFATVDVVVAERAALPSGTAQWIGAGVRAATEREVAAVVPGGTGQGEVWSASWRWWSHRPAASLAFSTPGRGPLPGIWRVEASWQAESFATNAAARQLMRQTRTRGALSVSDWLSGSVRYSLGAGLDAWTGEGAGTNGDAKAMSIDGSIERRFSRDRLALAAEAAHWFTFDAARPFDSAGVRALARSSTETRGWVFIGSAGVTRVSDAAPLGIWPGAGDGRARPPLARAHPLLDDGVISPGGSSLFGRTLAYGSAEARRWLERPSLVRVAPAAFVDLARASRRAADGASAQVDLGAGLRVKVPGAAGVLRLDVARGVGDGATAFTIGWAYQ